MYKKIDIYLRNLKGVYAYECSTNQSKTCEEAKMKFIRKNNFLDSNQVKAIYSK